MAMMRKRVWKSEVARRFCEITGTSDPAKAATLLAEELTLRCNTNTPGYELARIASFQSAKIEECEMKDAGRLIPLPPGEFEFLIQVNNKDSRKRQNFSIAHEIGHTLVPDYRNYPTEKYDAKVMQWHAEQEEEFLCDVMASEILMPRREFKPRLAGLGVSTHAITNLGDFFNTSLEATAVNLVRTGLQDVAVIVWTPGYNKNDAKAVQNGSLFDDEVDPVFAPPKKKFRVKFALGYGAMSNFFFPRQKSIDNDSLIAQSAQELLQGREPRTCGIMALTHGHGEQEFFVDSFAYSVHIGNEKEIKIISLVSLQVCPDIGF